MPPAKAGGYKMPPFGLSVCRLHVRWFILHGGCDQRIRGAGEGSPQGDIL